MKNIFFKPFVYISRQKVECKNYVLVIDKATDKKIEDILKGLTWG